MLGGTHRRMNITKHFYERYIERVKGISNPQEVTAYRLTNLDALTRDINKMAGKLVPLYTGQIGDHVTRKFFTVQNYMVVTDSDETAMITIYRIDLGFSVTVDQEIEKLMLKEIGQQRGKVSQEVDNHQDKMNTLKKSIEDLKERHHDLEEALKANEAERQAQENLLKTSSSELIQTRNELKRLVTRLVNPLYYQDIKAKD